MWIFLDSSGLFAYFLFLFSLSLTGRTSLLNQMVTSDDVIDFTPSASEAPVAVNDFEPGLESIFDDDDDESTNINSLYDSEEVAIDSSCSSAPLEKSRRQEKCSPHLSQEEDGNDGDEIDILRGPLDPAEVGIILGPLGRSAETEYDNFVLNACPVAVAGGPSIPVCSSSRSEDTTIDYEGFRTLEKCELCGFFN